MQLSFLGAAGTVTGSKYLLSFGDKKILIDCGLFQGHRELRSRNWENLPVKARDIDAVILTHAHIDHSGYLPLLMKQGFTGPIYSTLATKELCAILLPNSGALQEEEAYFMNKHALSRHKPALPLYTKEDGAKVLKQFVTKNFDVDNEILKGVHVCFMRAGHILGSSLVRITYEGRSIVFSGDMGRAHDDVMGPPAIVEEADVLVLESTYGDRLHDPEPTQERLGKIINQTVQRGGSVIIPAFAVGRAQMILYHIAELKNKKMIPNIPVFLDSPMAVDATDLLCQHIDELRINQEECNLSCKVAHYVDTPAESKTLNHHGSSSIIISASGMAAGGRVLHHLRFFAPDARNTIIFTGYQAGGTRGSKIVNGEKEIKIYGDWVPIHAQVEVMTNLSAHADYQEILDWLKNFKKAPQKVFITHGEGEARISLKEKIEKQFGWTCVLPEYLQVEELYRSPSKLRDLE